MTDANIISVLLALIIAVLAWIGNRIHTRLDDINKTLIQFDKDVRADIKDVRDDVGEIDTRVAVMESRCTINHDRRASA